MSKPFAMRLKKAILSFLFLPILAFEAQAVEVEMASSSQGVNQKLYGLLSNGSALTSNWTADPGRQLVKINVTLRQTQSVGRVELAACKGEFVDPAEMFINYDEGYVFSEAGKSTLRFLVPAGLALQSFTIGFRYAEKVCLSSIRLFDRDGHAVSLTVPTFLSSEWKWTGVSQEEAGTGFLSDGRVDQPWMVDLHQPEQKLEIDLGREMTVKGLRIWNGHQRSSRQFQEIGRVSQIRVSESQIVSIADRMGPQEVLFKEPLKTRHLALRIVGLVPGRRRGFAISELRVLTEAGELMGEPERTDQHVHLPAKFADLIDRSLSFNDDGEVWVLRLRSDGSFFFHGFSENPREAHSYIYSGTFTSKERGAEGVDLLLTGFRRASSMILDSDPCGRPCAGPRHELNRDELVHDVLRLQRREKNVIRVFNPTPPARQIIRVAPLKMHILKSDD